MEKPLRDATGVLLATVLGTLAVGFLAAAAWSAADRLRVLVSYRQAEGEVARVEFDRSGARFAVHRVEVHFRPCGSPAPHDAEFPGLEKLPAWPRFAAHPGSECDPRGETAPRRVHVNADGFTALRTGDRVTVYWHPAHTRDVRVGAFSTFWFLPLALALLGGIPGGHALQIVRELRRVDIAEGHADPGPDAQR
jgi:hypothetical protein